MFARYASRGAWRFTRHLEHIDKLYVQAAGGGVRAMVNIPPQHGKSQLCSLYGPAWLLAIYPDKRVVLASYEADFAARWGAGARDLLEQHGPRVGVHVRGDSSARHRWEIDGHTGGMISVGVGGALTGRGADVLIIDDPVKGPIESQSETYQERIWDWYRTVAYTRLQPNGSIIIIQTRWHENDLSGRLIDQEPDMWQRLILPAIALEDDPLGREPGEALWPARYDEAYLAETRKIQGEYWWNAQYQQSPSPPGGALFHRAWYRHHSMTREGEYLPSPTLQDPSPRRYPVRECRRFCTIDSASSQRTSADHTVIATWDAHVSSGRLFLVDMVRERFEAPDIGPAARVVFDTYTPLYLVVEKDGIGLAVIQQIKRDGIPVREIRAKDYGDKWGRASTAAPKMESGLITWPSHLREFEEELASFPYGAHDDMVDTLAYAAIHQASMGTGRARMSTANAARLPDPRGAAGRRR